MDLLIKNYISYKTNVYLSRYLIDITIYKENQKISLSIPSKLSDDWEEIKRRIDLQLSSFETVFQECPICYKDDKTQKHIVSCNHCSAKWCNRCFIEMTRNSMEVSEDFYCPFCRFCFTGEIPTVITCGYTAEDFK